MHSDIQKYRFLSNSISFGNLRNNKIMKISQKCMERKSMSIRPQLPAEFAQMTGKLASITDKVGSNDRKTWPDWPQGA